MHYTRLWYAIGVILVAAVIIGSLVPLPRATVLPNDKLLHFLIYFILMSWFGQLGRQRIRLAIVFALLGLTLELLQGQTRYRYFEWADVTANTAGVALAWLAILTPFGKALGLIDRGLTRLHRLF